MTRPLPMLAKVLPDNFSVMSQNLYVAEEKFDGHRMCVWIHDGPPEAWSREGKTCTQKIHPLMLEELETLPFGIYDGELIFPGGHSYDITVIGNRNKLHFVVFDLLELEDVDTTRSKMKDRRSALEQIFIALGGLQWVQLAKQYPVDSRSSLQNVVEDIWARSGEGVIVKDVNAPYLPGKRTKHFLKVKDVKSAVLTVVGFAPSEGLLNNRGPCGTTVLRDEEGNYTVVKTLDDITCRKLEERFTHPRIDKHFPSPNDGEWERVKIANTWVEFNTSHEDVGRKLRIDYHERTPDNSYRHARWDRWEEEP